MSREKMIERLIERIQEADNQTLEEFFWYLEMELEG